MITMDHGIAEPRYPNGRQFFSYLAVIRYARATGRAYRFQTYENGQRMLCLYSPRDRRFLPMRGTSGPTWAIRPRHPLP